ncbi:MAG: isoprenylcysteine carboxylmethyltransferase family protein [Bdellovibrionota bacterium]
MPAWLLSAICIALFLTHSWMMFFHRQKMRAEPSDKPQDPLFTKWSQHLVFAGILIAQLAMLYRRILMAYDIWPLGFKPYDLLLIELLDFLPLPASDLTLILGASIFFAGYSLRAWAIRILGRFFTFEIGIRSKHQIIESGPYRWIRHPSYTGYLLMHIGMGLAYSSLFFILGLGIGTLVFFGLRIHQEERMLVRHFGPSYERYMRRTKRLVPKVF